jgi:hypothetical protein
MSNFNGRPYLRVLTPRTTDGVNLLYDENLQVKYKESHFELTARAALEKENLTLPRQLRHIIKVMDGPEDMRVVENTVGDGRTDFQPRPQRVPRQNPKPENVTPAKIVVEPAERQRRKRRSREEMKAEKNTGSATVENIVNA